jgi:hypothetical protein
MLFNRELREFSSENLLQSEFAVIYPLECNRCRIFPLFGSSRRKSPAFSVVWKLQKKIISCLSSLVADLEYAIGSYWSNPRGHLDSLGAGCGTVHAWGLWGSFRLTTCRQLTESHTHFAEQIPI